MNKEQSVDFQYPDDEMEAEQNLYREASRKFLRVLNMSIAYIAHAENKEAAMWAVSYALGLAVCEGVSITDRAWQLRISPQALSKYIKEFQSQLNINTKTYTYGNRKNQH